MTEDKLSDVWKLLRTLSDRARYLDMRKLFARDPDRFSCYSLEVAGLFLDYSKNLITEEILTHLFDLAREQNLEDWIQRMFSGDRINSTENRPVLHAALRNRSDRPILVDQQDVMPDIRAVLGRISSFVEAVHSGEWCGTTGERITDVVNIGIGGSDLGPHMVVEALRDYRVKGLNFHFVSNIDGADLAGTLEKLKPESTLFIIASKTFTTQETMTNARSAKSWFLRELSPSADVARHFVAVSTNRRQVEVFGIDPVNMFEFWDWVGGRYSLWSAIGLSIALAVGMKNFDRLRAGAYAMDEHFRTSPAEQNMPVLLALIGIWNRNFMGMNSLAVLPYDQRLHLLPAYLQQCEMESNGKSIGLDGDPVPTETCPVIWGEPGTNGQHAFYQLIHQGTDPVAVDFIVALTSDCGLDLHHKILVANCFAQAEALMQGKSTEQAYDELEDSQLDERTRSILAKHKTFDGNKPSNMLLIERVTPETFGALIALYEHKVFVQGVLWGINSFDQWGVELGKKLANDLLTEIDGDLKPEQHDASTNGLLKRFKSVLS